MSYYDFLPKPLYSFLDKIFRRFIVPPMKSLSEFVFSHSKCFDANQDILRNLHNIHEGKRAFIVGNGPSLTVEDLNRIQENGDISFASNHIWKIFGETEWRPTYYASVNDGIPRKQTKTMVDKAEAEYKFLRTSNYLQLKGLSGNKLFVNVQGKGTIENPKFAENIVKVIYAMGTTTFVLIELAVYMGCKELYIIGCDNRYSITQTEDGKVIYNNDKSYFSEADKTARQVPVETWQMELAYEFAKQYADAHGIKIYNAGRGGHLETFERIDFDYLFC